MDASHDFNSIAKSGIRYPVGVGAFERKDSKKVECQRDNSRWHS